MYVVLYFLFLDSSRNNENGHFEINSSESNKVI